MNYRTSLSYQGTAYSVSLRTPACSARTACHAQLERREEERRREARNEELAREERQYRERMDREERLARERLDREERSQAKSDVFMTRCGVKLVSNNYIFVLKK